MNQFEKIVNRIEEFQQSIKEVAAVELELVALHDKKDKLIYKVTEAKAAAVRTIKSSGESGKMVVGSTAYWIEGDQLMTEEGMKVLM